MSYASHLIFDSLFSGPECERIWALPSGLERIAAGLEGVEGSDLDHDMRVTDITWIARSNATEWIFERLKSCFAEANQTYDFALSGISEDLQYTIYDRPGAFYTWHHDGLDDGVEDRKLSLALQLSPAGDYQGCDLDLPEIACDFTEAERKRWRGRARRQGTAIVFPSFEYHQVTPLLSGARHSLVSWISGPPFR